MLAVAGEANKIFIQLHANCLKNAAGEVRLVRMQTKHISSTVFNVNVQTEEEKVCFLGSLTTPYKL